jgi:hypothetical protein
MTICPSMNVSVAFAAGLCLLPAGRSVRYRRLSLVAVARRVR